GTVYRAVDDNTPREVAIKVPRVTCLDDPGGWERYLKLLKEEAGKVAMLDHPAIAKLFHFEDDPFPYVVMQYVNGEPLDAILRSGKTFSGDETVALVGTLAEALQKAHDNRLL